MVTPGGRTTSTLPFGPSKWTERPASTALTFPSSLMGSLPMRLMSVHRADQLAAHVLLAGLAVCKDALRGGENAGAETAEHARDVPHRDVAAESGTAHPADADDDRALVWPILELDRDFALNACLVLDVVGDEALRLEHPGNLHLHLRGGDDHLVVTRPRCIADAGQHVPNGVVHRHDVILILSS